MLENISRDVRKYPTALVSANFGLATSLTFLGSRIYGDPDSGATLVSLPVLTLMGITSAIFFGFLEDSLYKSTSNAIQRSGFESVNLRNSFQKSHARIYAEESERVNEFESALADVA